MVCPAYLPEDLVLDSCERKVFVKAVWTVSDLGTPGEDWSDHPRYRLREANGLIPLLVLDSLCTGITGMYTARAVDALNLAVRSRPRMCSLKRR